MPYVGYSRKNKQRILISGTSNTGKTTSLQTFVNDDQNMIILTCPGEKGIASLPTKPNINTPVYEVEEGKEIDSKIAIREFISITNDILNVQKPDVLAVDGIHKLYDQWMNALSDGDFLRTGEVITTDARGRESDETGRTYGKCHKIFGNYLNMLSLSSIPLIVVTTWEEWEFKEDNLTKYEQRDAVRQLWPALPGKMSKAVIGEFDARISARMSKRCFHKDCKEKGEDHYVWQLLNKGDVAGVGVKGLRNIPPALKQAPFIHQDYHILQQLIEACR